MSLAILSSCSSTPAGQGALAAPAATISHDVFFTLPSFDGQVVDDLVAACEGLRAIPGVTHLTAGPRDEAQTGGANETSFAVALHVEFLDQAAYDGYLPHPVHQALVSEFLPKTSAIVVYDSLINR